MATIIAVHGTFATGPEKGDGWWQRGGALDRDIRKLVEADDSRIDFAPHVWDGQNSETSRRAAGQALLKRIAGLEQLGEKYCLIGHSHGGSVVASAVFAAGSRRNALPGLSRWLTVGTPFIRGRRHGLLFSRLGLWGKAAYISYLAFPFYVTAVLVWSHIRQPDPDLPAASIAIFIAFLALMLFLPFVLLHTLLWWRDRNRSRLFRPKDHLRARETFRGRWLAFRHPGDEAVEGLSSVHRIELPIFSRRFLVAPLLAVTVLLAPLVAIYAGEVIPLPDPPSFEDGVKAAQKLAAIAEAKGIPAWSVGVGVLVAMPLAVVALTVFLPAAGLVLAVQALAARLSAVLSRVFDRITWHQIRQSAFGNDTIGEVAVEAADRPVWLAGSPAPLPEELSNEVSAFADSAAAQSVSKLRRAVQLLAFSEGEQEKSDLLAEYLTWDELIHTAYFRVPRFRKLVAYAIAHSPGFRPSDRFRSDPDFATVARWYQQLSA